MAERQEYKYYSYPGYRKHQKKVKRREHERQLRAGFLRHVNMLKRVCKKNKTKFIPLDYREFRRLAKIGPKPAYRTVLKFLLEKFEKFSPDPVPNNETGELFIPQFFSLADHYEETMFFLKRLFNLLHTGSNRNIILNYARCTRIDLDASIVMDLILYCFIRHYKRCSQKGHHVAVKNISSKSVDRLEENTKKMLFSIGTPRNVQDLRFNFNDVITFDLRTGDNNKRNKSSIKEIHETEIVDYVLKCLKRMNRTLTPDAETDLSKVVGEVMANAEEHSKFRYRFAIGYFQDTIEAGSNHIGTFNLVIFNFGKTIYETFKNEQDGDSDVANQMKNLSNQYTSKGLFKSQEFEEETLWTLYALQEGVTSVKGKRRGNGSIRFIESFFNLKGDLNKDNKSKLSIISGNTRITFDGTYPLFEIIKGKSTKRKFKMVTFNETQNIEDKPDKDFVNFVPPYFPGTLISTKIVLTYKNIENIDNGNGE